MKNYELKIYRSDFYHFPLGDQAMLVTGRRGEIYKDDSKFREEEKIREIFLKIAEIASSAEDHFNKTKNKIKSEGLKGFSVFPVVKYEHGMVALSIGTIGSCRFDSGFWGVLVYDNTSLGRRLTPAVQAEKDIKKIEQWMNGDIYRYTLYEKVKNCSCESCHSYELVEIDSCGGFYDIEDIRSELPEEFKNKDLSGYFIE